ncbi:hypothetical protein Poli38472_002205 [Pythium oligandrum]|uniref:Branchpoint-bridging protein n=1 Tax=Pythium oligandrum TaxID=41045 RepID=A0A8K1CGS9_PYTOL|nr:hypothetical protein Poli38472_002205 [Pythium oligandrum]|eukprot:TMW63264.1 hypothetical protein Poli38472_002205 [Pythium oligandrum]
MADEGNGFAAFMAFMDGDDSKKGASHVEETTKKENAASVDEYGYEEEQEREAMMKTYHHPMKTWFRVNPHLTETYGQFPLFWQDLKKWTPYREVLKKYLRETEGGGSKASTDESSTTTTTEAKATETKAQDTATTPSAVTTESGSGEAPKRRRKSRWGDAVEETSAVETNTGEQRRKKSRWAPAGSTPAANLVNILTQQQQQTVALRAKLDVIGLKLQTVAVDAARIEKDPTRSPSPPPQYDANGKRTNTREVRMRAALEKQRQEVMDEMVKLNPLFRPPADYMRQKLSRKVYIPVNDFPNYNFIGLIIGPRGNTQKRMEKETNCRIAIRGRGSVKEGSKGKKVNADENDDLHVLITGEREDDIDRAVKEVEALLVPMDDMKNEHKQNQLRELAKINGTLRDDDFCHICGEKGHRQYECPNREKTFRPVEVKCAICGDSSHPTRDCTQRGKSAGENAEIDKEYQSFMQQLGEKPVISTATKTVASAPWLQPAKSSTTSNTQPWMTGAPGTSDAPPPPGTQAPGTQAPLAMGSTPATAFPPPTAATAAYGYAPQAQAWNQWGAGYYYGSWDQTGAQAAATGAEYQYGHYAPAPGATTDAQQGAAPGAEYAYQYPPYQ